MSNQIPQQTPPPSDEIDLGQLFQIIGNGFKKLFNFIWVIFKTVFHIIIDFLLFIRKHFLKFIITGIIGLSMGIYLDMQKDTKYISTMVVEPNFNSVQQLYNNINFYNELAQANDSLALAETFNISVREASLIKKFEIESFSDENQKIQLFDRFVRTLDSTTQKAIDMDSYLKNFNSFDARFHNILVIATSNEVVKKIQPAIISSISRNDYFKLQQSVNSDNLKLQDSIYNRQFVEIDSLQKLYKRVMEKEAEKPLQGTNISLGENGNLESKELALINQMDKLKENLVQLNLERANKTSILNVISAFPRKGVEVKGLLKTYKVLIPALLLGLLLGILTFVEINRFLINYKPKS